MRHWTVYPPLLWVSLRTVRKWKSRYRQGGIEAQKSLAGNAIAARLGHGRSSVFRALRKLDCSRLVSLEVKPQVRRYQWEKLGQMLHLDIKCLSKIDGVGHRKVGSRQAYRRRPGWEYLYVCVDEASRMACTAIFPDETAESAVEFLRSAVAWYTVPRYKTRTSPDR